MHNQAQHIDKAAVHNNFYKSRFDYEDNAFVQKKMAARLASLIGTEYETILEIGCGIGTLTKHLYPVCTFLNYYAFDIIGEYKIIFERKYPNINFSAFDMDKIDEYYPPYSFDLIVSNAAVQWSFDGKKLVHALMRRLAPGGTLALSFFGEHNFQEIKSIFGVGLKYLTARDLEELCSRYSCLHFSEQTETIPFAGVMDILRHIQKTGVGGMAHAAVKKSQIKQYEQQFGSVLTYHPVYLILKNTD